MLSFLRISQNHLLIAALTIGVTAGCGRAPQIDGLVPASGVLIYKDEPVHDAQVVFIPEEGQPAIGQTDENGRFELETSGQPGAMPGNYQVAVTAFDWKRPISAEEFVDLPSEAINKLKVWRTPEKYSNIRTSELHQQVQAEGENNFELILE